MKFTIEQKTLASALSQAARIIERRNTIPVLSNIVVSAEGQIISLRATDLDIEVTLSVDAAVHEEGSTTVPGHLFADIVRKMHGEVAFKHNAQSAAVSSGRSKFSLQTLSPEDFPDLSIGAFTHSFTMKCADLRNMFRRAAFAISTEETRYYLNGIFMHSIEDRGVLVLRAVATDGHRLAQVQHHAPDGSAGMPGIIIPRKTVAEVEKILDCGDQVSIEVSETKIRFRAGNVVLTSKLIDGTFPDYQRVIPQMNNKKAIADRSDLSKAVDRVSTVSTERGRAVKVTLDQGTITLHVNNPGSGEAMEEMAVDYDAELIEIGFNAKYINDIMGNIESEKVELYLEDAGSPTRIHPVGDEGTVYVLMPMRV